MAAQELGASAKGSSYNSRRKQLAAASPHDPRHLPGPIPYPLSTLRSKTVKFLRISQKIVPNWKKVCNFGNLLVNCISVQIAQPFF